MSSWLRRFGWVLLVLVGCGGTVIVDDSPTSYELTPQSFCDWFCAQVHGIASVGTTSCSSYDFCLDDCVHWYKTSEKYNCLEEFLPLYECAAARMEQRQQCGFFCTDEEGAWRSCWTEAPEPPPEP